MLFRSSVNIKTKGKEGARCRRGASDGKDVNGGRASVNYGISDNGGKVGKNSTKSW